ncbi:MAG: hypothetical protein JXA10_12500, partial [Anaerolineae bacterium]|nr:hypothetical protein [Anaerolineae bacterium]
MNPVKTSLRWWEWSALIAILLMAAALRMGAPGITEFKRDEANLSQLALNLVEGRDFPLLGIRSSVNVPNPPLNVYLFALPYAVDHTPVTATLFVGALNVIAVALTIALARRYYGVISGLVAGMLYAASPWAVIYSRKIWAQDLLPPFIVATVFMGLLGYGENKRWARWLHWPLLAITVQIHYGAFTLIPLSLLMLALWRPRVNWRTLGIGIGLAALTGIPVLIGAIQNDLFSLDTIRDGLDQNEAHERVISTTALDYARLTVAGTDIHSLAGPEQFQNYLDSVPDVYGVFDLIPLAAIIAAGWLLWRVGKQKTARTSPDGVLVAWLIIPVIAFTWEWTEVAPHYMIPLMPAAYILCGVALAALARIKVGQVRTILLSLGGSAIMVIAGLQIYLFVALLDFLDTHETPNGFGTPLHYLLDVRAEVLAHDPNDVIVISDQEKAPYEEIPAVWGVLLDDVPSVRFVNGSRTAVIPAGESVELVARVPDPADDTAARRANFVVRPAQTQLDLENLTAIDPVRFANGATLTGCAINLENVILRYELDGSITEDYQVFIHALDANGARVSQIDRMGWPGHYWRAGDTLFLWFGMVLPPQTVSLYIGMYITDGVNYENAAVIDAQGAYVDQGATITLDTFTQ